LGGNLGHINPRGNSGAHLLDDEAEDLELEFMRMV
jgi:hypothetical protein